MEKKEFGKVEEKEAHLYLLKNEDLEVEVSNYGASLVSIKPFGMGNICLSYPDVKGYEEDTYFIGATVVPCANRTKDAKFTLNGKEYELEKNDGGVNNLHTSHHGSHKKLWREVYYTDDQLILQLTMMNEEFGFPGNRTFTITFKIEGPSLSITYGIKTDEETIFNPTNHVYFHLGERIEDCVLRMDCSSFTPIGPDSVPTGEVRNVQGTPMDFLEEKRIGDQLLIDDEQLSLGKGFDHSFCIDDYDGTMKEALVVKSIRNGLSMKMETELPCFQFYTGNYLGDAFEEREGMAFETQFTPNAINMDGFIQPIVEEEKEHTTKYTFEKL